MCRRGRSVSRWRVLAGSWRSTEHSRFGISDRILRPTSGGRCGLLLDPKRSVVDGRGHSCRFPLPRVDPGPPGDTARTTPQMDRRPSVASPRSGVLVSLGCGSMSRASHTPTLSNQSQKPSQTSRRTARKPVAEPRKPIRHQGFFELPTNRKESVKPRPAFGVGGLPTGFLEDY